jgi:hypothetical protein
MSGVFFLAGMLLLSGCTGLFEKQPQSPWAIIKHESRQCLSDLKNDPQLSAIAGKVTLDTAYDRDAYFDLLNIEDVPTSTEKIAIKKWALKLENCYKIKAEGYAYESRDVALWSAALDSDQLVLILELQKGNLSYGKFAAKRLEVDTAYREKIVQAVAAGYKKPDYSPRPNYAPQPRSSEIQKRPVTSF